MNIEQTIDQQSNYSYPSEPSDEQKIQEESYGQQKRQNFYKLNEESLDPQLKGLEIANTIQLIPFVKPNCCPRDPQFYYGVYEGEENTSKNLGYIMHGRQGQPHDLHCCQQYCKIKFCKLFCDISPCEAQCNQCQFRCINCLGCTLDCCGIFCGTCVNSCKALFACNICGEGGCCQPCKTCCDNLQIWVAKINQISDYENYIQVDHSVSPLGVPISEKDGYYVGKQEFGFAALFRYKSLVSDYYLNDVNVIEIIAQNSKKQKIDEITINIEKQQLKGFPILQDNKYEKQEKTVNEILAYQSGLTYNVYKQLYLDVVDFFKESYPVRYKGKFIGRYVYGRQEKVLMHLYCPCCSCAHKGGLDGYSVRDDIYLLDNYDRLLYRITQTELQYCEACLDQRKGYGEKYKLEIKNPKGVVVGELRKKADRKCFGCVVTYSYIITFPKDATPIQKFLLTYLAPYVNEKRFHIWNQFELDLYHNQEPIEHDTQYPPSDFGIQEVVLDRLVDVERFGVSNQNEHTEIIQQSLQNPNREEGEVEKVQSYEENIPILREYERRKKYQLKSSAVQQFIFNDYMAVQQEKLNESKIQDLSSNSVNLEKPLNTNNSEQLQ